MKTHELKIRKHWFDRLMNGSKSYEIRKHDRDFQIGDTIVFFVENEEDLSQLPRYEKNNQGFVITHILPASVFPEGLKETYSIISLQKL